MLFTFCQLPVPITFYDAADSRETLLKVLANVTAAKRCFLFFQTWTLALTNEFGRSLDPLWPLVGPCRLEDGLPDWVWRSRIALVEPISPGELIKDLGVIVGKCATRVQIIELSTHDRANT